jgi:hypothetical protein
MADPSVPVTTCPIRALCRAAALVIAIGVSAAGARADDAELKPDAPAQVVAPAKPPEPEVFRAIGRFIDQSISNLGATLKAAPDALGETTKGAGDVAKTIAKDAAGAADALVRLPGSRTVAGRERCVPAPNGAPDCRVASETLCKANGYETGRSIDIQSTRKCSAQAWLSGRMPSESECTQESFVVRAVCQ